jgi:hypothetical protein
MHAFVLADSLLALVVSLVVAIVSTSVVVGRASNRWPSLRVQGATVAGYRDSLHIAGTARGTAPREVIALVAVAIAQLTYLVLSHALFVRTALRLDLWRVRPVAVRLVIVQSVFLVPAALVYLRAAIGLLRREGDSDPRARFTAGAYLAIRAMRVVAGLAVASEFSSGFVAWSRIYYALPGFALAFAAGAIMLRAANAADLVTTQRESAARGQQPAHQ